MQFPALASKWWEWKAAKAETFALRTKYGKWMGKAKVSNQRPLYPAKLKTECTLTPTEGS